MPNPRNPKNYCLNCNEFCRGSSSNLCSKCKSIQTQKDYGETHCISDFTPTFARHKYQSIRNHAHKIAKLYGLKKICFECGYSRYVELCHKHSIANFPKETKLSVVNDISNLVFLCPTHHYELDHPEI